MEFFEYMILVANYYALEYDPVFESANGYKATPIPFKVLEKAYESGLTPSECAGDVARLAKKYKLKKEK